MKQVPAHTIEGNEVVFADGVRYRRANHSGPRATPEEMYRAITGCDLPKASAADLAAAQGRKVNLGTIDHRG